MQRIEAIRKEQRERERAANRLKDMKMKEKRREMNAGQGKWDREKNLDMD